MSDVIITSTTDTPEQVLAAQGRAAPEVKAETEVEKTAAGQTAEPETLEASETSNDENESQADSEEDSEEQRPRKKGGIEKKIGKLTKQRAEARAEAEYWKKEALKQQSAPAAQTQVQAPKQADGKPKAEEFETHDAYVEALADWKVEKKLSESQARAREQELKSEEDRQLKTHYERVQKFTADHDDFDDVIAEVDEIPMSLTVSQVILNSDNGPELMYELAKDPEEYKRICNLPAIQAARELGKFEARIAASKESKEIKIKTSKAPKPVSPVSRGAAASSKDPGDMNYDEFKAWREQSLRG